MITLSRRRSTMLTAVMVLLTVGLGAWLWILQPEKAVAWAISTLFLPAAWIGVLIYSRSAHDRSAVEASVLQLERGIIGAGFILASAMGAILATSLGWIGGTARERIVGAMLGGVLMVTGNALPKTISRPRAAAAECSESGAQGTRRFAGWTFVLAGLAYTLAWLSLPVDVAGTVSTAVCALGLAIVLARVVPSMLSRRREQDPPSREEMPGL